MPFDRHSSTSPSLRLKSLRRDALVVFFDHLASRWLLLVGLVISNAFGCAPEAAKPIAKGDSSTASSKPDETPREVPKRAARVEVQLALEPATPAKAQPTPEEKPQQVHRPDDARPKHDDRALLEAGVRVYESKRLKLYTDIDETAAKPLPGYVDQLYAALEAYFGPMPPDRAKTDFQMTGYLMKDMALFRELGLLPEEILIEHGRHLGNRFWMRDQGFEYYRRHLMFHEATHCFMTYMPDVQAPVWYLEGMAELFGTHRLDAEDKATFRVMPTSLLDFAGFGRIETIRQDVARRNPASIAMVLKFQPIEFRTLNHYSWSWALCAFLDGSPKYHERFQKLGQAMHGGQFVASFLNSFDNDFRDMETEWTLFTFHLQEGYDLVRSAIQFESGTELSKDDNSKVVQILADRGWQSTRIRLMEGRTYQIQATGRFSLGDRPKPWVSEAQGITYRYFEANPVGMLLGCLDDGHIGGLEEPMLQIIALGKKFELQAPRSGTLYLRLNDAWNSLYDNHGQVEVMIRAVP